MSGGSDWVGMFKAMAESWNWTPEQVRELTPGQLAALTGDDAADKPIKLAGFDDIPRWQKWFEETGSPEAVRRRAERVYARHLLRTGQADDPAVR